MMPPRAFQLRLALVAATSTTLFATSVALASATGGQRLSGDAAPPLTGSAASATCSKAEAREAVRRLRLGHPELADPVHKVLCGAFAGPGRRTMVVSLLGPGSLGMLDWVVLRWEESEWRLLLRRHQAAVITAAGSDIREKVFIYRPGDSRCCPSGGSRSRIWHWNGARFTASAWTAVTLHLTNFSSPGRNIWCFGDQARKLLCGVNSTPIHTVQLGRSGTLTICNGPRCVQNSNIGARNPVLGYGRRNEHGGFRCLSLRSGVRCTVIRSGRGFLINRQGVRRIGP